jgi:hypothetical protein
MKRTTATRGEQSRSRRRRVAHAALLARFAEVREHGQMPSSAMLVERDALERALPATPEVAE